MERNRKNLKMNKSLLLRLAGSTLLLGFLFSSVDFNQLVSVWRSASLVPMLLVLAGLLGSLFFGSLRWSQLLPTFGLSLPWRNSFMLCWSSIFFNQALPGSNGGDVMRGIFFAQKQMIK